MEFLFALLLCPFLVIIFSIVSFSLSKKWFIAPVLTFSIFTILTYTSLGSTFFFWAVAYSVLSLVTSIIMILKKS
ncbi:DUF2651 family protein [Metasolibacillus sp.]|uniref:DUF2651 family protein n=1 Tax=Metasolibacillus sp. TaxID=2703680 RepID=UPI00344A2D34